MVSESEARNSLFYVSKYMAKNLYAKMALLSLVNSSVRLIIF